MRYHFARLLVETGKDFSLRSVHQLIDVGISVDEYKLEHRTSSASSDQGTDLYRSASTGPPELRREKSSEIRRAEEEVAARAPLVRHSSDEMVDRFHGMKSWEDSDHPIGKTNEIFYTFVYALHTINSMSYHCDNSFSFILQHYFS